MSDEVRTKAHYSTAVTALGLLCFALAITADVLPLWGYFHNPEDVTYLIQFSSVVLRGSYLSARDSVVPRDVFLEVRTGFGHSSIFSNMDECPKPVRPSRKTSRGTTESLART
ncbi:hypothetical protein O3M35_006109 [Rhynocoris fuscipes]|uniref:Uncharacterized protein n=1 Tax=Rhynocoris fuscipes TaxID=488301 RepID=A0AAW1DHD4_9HEMI